LDYSDGALAPSDYKEALRGSIRTSELEELVADVCRACEGKTPDIQWLDLSNNSLSADRDLDYVLAAVKKAEPLVDKTRGLAVVLRGNRFRKLKALVQPLAEIAFVRFIDVTVNSFDVTEIREFMKKEADLGKKVILLLEAHLDGPWQKAFPDDYQRIRACHAEYYHARRELEARELLAVEEGVAAASALQPQPAAPVQPQPPSTANLVLLVQVVVLVVLLLKVTPKS
jgi:hypothetical protein